MDMQGTPVGGNPSTKVTTDSKSYTNATEERAGAVASESLAAESTNSGGGFAQNRGSEPLGVSGSNFTFANTDSSNAETLPPARDARARDDDNNETGRGEKYAEGAGGQGNYPGSHAGGSYSGGSTGAQQESKASSGGYSGNANSSGSEYGGDSTGSTGGQGGSDNASSAPGYVSNVTQPYNSQKVKGSNITEGSEEDFRGPSNQDAEIGSENDPGLRAEKDFQKMTQQSSGSTAPKQGGSTGEGQYGTLSDDQNL